MTGEDQIQRHYTFPQRGLLTTFMLKSMASSAPFPSPWQDYIAPSPGTYLCLLEHPAVEGRLMHGQIQYNAKGATGWMSRYGQN